MFNPEKLNGWYEDDERLIAQHEGWTLSETLGRLDRVDFWLYHCAYPQSAHRNHGKVVCRVCKEPLSKQLSLIWKAL